MWRRSISIALLILLVVAAGACATPTSIPAPTWPSAPTPATGGSAELRLAGGDYDPPTLDPALANDSSSTFVIRQLFGGLVALDNNLDVVPDIAERWDISADGRVYTFTLRAGVQFHDGRPVEAEDLRYSLERACDPSLADALPCGTYLNDIVGVREKLAGQAETIAGIRVIGDRTLVITIDAPRAYFLAKLTYNTAYVVDRNNVEQGDDWTEQPNGTGPFRLAEWEHNQRLVLARNERYHRDPPHLQKVTILMGAAGSDPLYLYEQDEIDYTEVGTGVVARLEYDGSPLASELRVSPQLSLYYIGLNSQMPPLDDPKVRQALTMAVDRAKIARVTYEGRLVQAQGILPPGIPGYDDTLAGLPYDREKARQLLAESRYGGPQGMPRIILYTSGDGLGELLQEVWREELGVEVELRQTEWADFLQGLDARRYPAFVLTWIADYPDPQNFIEVLFGSNNPTNHTAYSNPEVDRLLHEAAVEQDHDRRMELYRQAERLLVADAPVIPIAHGIDYTLTKPYVRGLEVTPMGLLDLSTIYIEGK